MFGGATAAIGDYVESSAKNALKDNGFNETLADDAVDFAWALKDNYELTGDFKGSLINTALNAFSGT